MIFSIHNKVPNRQRGIALVIVLWIITLMAIMAASFTYTMRAETAMTTFAMERAQARALADAGIAYAATKLLLAPDPENPWPTEGSPRDWRYGAGVVTLSVVDSSGKIDINHADRNLLAGLFSAHGFEEGELDALLDAIEDWRDPDDLKRLSGAEEDEYLSAGRPVGPKNAPFESIEELQQVLGVTPVLYEQIVDLITVAGHKGINPEVAPAEVLNIVPDIDLQLVEAYIIQRAESIADGNPLPPAPPLGPHLSKARGLAYHMTLDVLLDTGTKTAIKAVVTQSRRPGEVYHTLSWQEG